MALKDALEGGAVAGGLLALVALIIGVIVLPAVIAVGWWQEWWSFEFAVIALLVVIAYLSG